MASHFFALFSRMKNIDRWALMRNVNKENLSSHSLDVAAIAHCLALIGNERFGKAYNAERAAVLGIYHDMPEIITGDMPTPVKYYNREIRQSFGKIEEAARSSILDTLPEYLISGYKDILCPDESGELYKLVKAADKISALIKCIEEKNSGNMEFSSAEKATLKAIKELSCPEADVFVGEFLGSFNMVLDNIMHNS
ncbi:MAG: 5'-deoxynucleotidase [Oscillospiraceae bacterium]|nr:5'-deoxynucleotidase [Oscillospiraceae bacterium]